MKPGAFAFLVAFSCSVAVSANQGAPGCVSKCWDNSQYVTTCRSEEQCLCTDSDFQSTVLQCLYSQCHTAQFGSALHHTLSKCSDYPSTTSEDLPPLLRHQRNRKRAPQNQPTASVNVRPLVSAHQAFAFASAAYAVQSAPRRFAGASVAANYAQPTRSVRVNAARTSNRAFSTTTGLPSSLDDVGFNESLAPSGARTTNIFPSQTALASAVSGSGVGGAEPRVPLDETPASVIGARAVPTRTGPNSSTVANNMTNAVSSFIAKPLSSGNSASPYPSANSFSTVAVQPSTTSSGPGHGTMLPSKKIRKARWSFL